MRCNDLGSRRSSLRIFLSITTKKRSSAFHSNVYDGHKGRPSDKGRQLSVAFGTCNPSFVCDLSQDGASRSSGIGNGRQTRWLADLPSADVSDKKKSVPYKARAPFRNLKGILEILSLKGERERWVRCPVFFSRREPEHIP